MSYHNFHRGTLAGNRGSPTRGCGRRFWIPPPSGARLLDWDRAPSVRAAHPQEDHLIPLLVAVGAAEREPARIVYREENFMGKITISSYPFGKAPVQ